MTQNISATLSRPVQKSTCVHHWLIEPAVGPISRGVCKLCGEQKDFYNILDDFQTNEEIIIRSGEARPSEEDTDDEDKA
jgi:hypothetical protein